jgi:hypothetical protein
MSRIISISQYTFHNSLEEFTMNIFYITSISLWLQIKSVVPNSGL